MRADSWHLFASQCLVALKLAVVGVFTPQKLANATYQGFSFRHLPRCADEVTKEQGGSLLSNHKSVLLSHVYDVTFMNEGILTVCSTYALKYIIFPKFYT